MWGDDSCAETWMRSGTEPCKYLREGCSQQRDQQSKRITLKWDQAGLFQDQQGGRVAKVVQLTKREHCRYKWGCIQHGKMDYTDPCWPKILFWMSKKLLHGSLELFAVFTWAGEMSVLFHVNNFNLCILRISLNTFIFNLKVRMERKNISAPTRKFKMNYMHFI